MKTLLPCILPLLLLGSVLPATEQAFSRTAVGISELKILPASTLIASESSSHYFEADNGLFRPLFRYIQKNDIAMTTPVEASMQPGKMYFYIGAEAAKRGLTATDAVTVLELPERLVASIGARGSYSRANFEAARKKLEDWLEKHPTHEASGEARGVFWNGPFTPGFLKRFEVHIPVVERTAHEG